LRQNGAFKWNANVPLFFRIVRLFISKEAIFDLFYLNPVVGVLL